MKPGATIFSRRGFLAGATIAVVAPLAGRSLGLLGAGAAGAGTARAQAGVRDQVSILDYWSPGDSGANLPSAFASAFRAGRAVEIPAQAQLAGISGNIVVPDGKDLVLHGRIAGAAGSAAMITLEGSGTVFNDGGLFDDIPLRLRGGSPRIIGYRGRGRSHTALILIQGTGSYRGLHIEDWQVSDCNYGILRQGVGSALSGARILNGRAVNLAGDAVQWNVCVDDDDVQVVGLAIDGIDSGPGQARPNWGVGVGFAGSSYDPTWPASKTVKGFLIAQVTGKSLRQLVHVECGQRFQIAEISGEDISTAYSRGANVECATVICYGCKDFTIDTVRNRGGSPQSGVYARFGVAGGAYVAPCRDFTMTGVDLETGDLLIETGQDGGFATVRNVDLRDGSLICIGGTDTMHFESIRARRRRGAGAAIDINMQGVGDGRDRFRSRVSRLRMVDCQGVDEQGAASAALRLANGTVVEAQGNNFAVPALRP